MKALLALLLVSAPVTAPAPIVIRERGELRQVCAEYTTMTAPRQPNRACVDAALVREWILKNGPSGSCE